MGRAKPPSERGEIRFGPEVWKMHSVGTTTGIEGVGPSKEQKK